MVWRQVYTLGLWEEELLAFRLNSQGYLPTSPPPASWLLLKQGMLSSGNRKTVPLLQLLDQVTLKLLVPLLHGQIASLITLLGVANTPWISPEGRKPNPHLELQRTRPLSTGSSGMSAIAVMRLHVLSEF